MENIYKLTPEQIKSYQENGYLVVKNFLKNHEVEGLVRAAHDYAGDNIHNYLNFHRDVSEFNSTILRSDLHDICDQLNNSRMIPIGSVFFFCKPNNPLENGSNPHQDNYVAKAPFGSYFVASIALDNANAENGALKVWPRSHLLGELPFKDTKNFEFDDDGKLTKAYPIGSECQIPDGYEELILEYKKGDLILLHSHIIHAAEKNVSTNDNWRRQVYFHFIREGDPFWPGWNARRQIMDRGPRRL